MQCVVFALTTNQTYFIANNLSMLLSTILEFI